MSNKSDDDKNNKKVLTNFLSNDKLNNLSHNNDNFRQILGNQNNDETNLRDSKVIKIKKVTKIKKPDESFFPHTFINDYNSIYNLNELYIIKIK